MKSKTLDTTQHETEANVRLSGRTLEGDAATLNMLGIRVNVVGVAEILDFMASAIILKRQAVILHLNVFGANLAARQEWLKEFFSESQLVFCDGDGIRLGFKLLGEPAPPKVTYNVFLPHLARRCAQQNFSLYLLGSRPGIAERAADNLRALNPNLCVVGTHDGYFQKQGRENDALVADINRARPDVLLVCLGMPIQEQWVRDNSSRLEAGVIFTAGAALDYAAKVVPVAPGWMVRLHLEWLFRFLLEPRRLFARYIIGNPAFVAKVLIERMRRRKVRSAIAENRKA